MIPVNAVGRHQRDCVLSFPAGLLVVGAAGAAPLNLDFTAIDPCPRGSADEIVVCGSRSRQNPYRLPKIASEYDRKPLSAEGKIAGVPTRAHAESSVRQDGYVDKRLMITFSTPF